MSGCQRNANTTRPGIITNREFFSHNRLNKHTHMDELNKSDLPPLEDVVEDIHRVLEETGLSPADISVSQYSRAGGKYDGRMLRRMGGFRAIVDEAFRDQMQKDIVTSRYLAGRRSYVNKLERQIGDKEAFQKNLLDSWKRVLEEAGPAQVSKLDKPALPEKEKKERANLAVISDIHLGLKIDKDEVGNNAYDWTIGARRLGKYAEQVADYKIDHRDECQELRVCLGGDLGQGVIHDDYGTDAIAYQNYGITLYLTQVIDYWRHHYNKITVEFTTDNHMRMPHRGPERNFHQKWDNFSTFGVALPLQMAFRGCSDVEFHVPKSAITTFNLLGHKFALTHGDTHLNSGSLGKIDVSKISHQVLKLNAAQTDGKHYDAIIMGHVHTPLYMHLNETNSFLVINGTGSGTDAFAASMGFFRTKPTQVLMEVTKSYPVGDFRIIDLSDADNEKRYESIIQPYKYGLEVSGSGGVTFPHMKK